MAYVHLARANYENVQTQSLCENSYTFLHGLLRNFVRIFVSQNLSNYVILPQMGKPRALDIQSTSLITTHDGASKRCPYSRSVVIPEVSLYVLQGDGTLLWAWKFCRYSRIVVISAVVISEVDCSVFLVGAGGYKFADFSHNYPEYRNMLLDALLCREMSLEQNKARLSFLRP